MVSAIKIKEEIEKVAESVNVPGRWGRAKIEPSLDLMPCDCNACSISRIIIGMIARMKGSSNNAGPIRLCVEKAEVRKGKKSAVPPGDYVKITIADPGPGPWREVMVRAARRRPGRRDHPREHLLDAIRSIIKRHGGRLESGKRSGAHAWFSFILPETGGGSRHRPTSRNNE